MQVTQYNFGKDLFRNRLSGNIEDQIEIDISGNSNNVSRWTEKNPAISSKRIDSLVYFTNKLSGIDDVIKNKSSFLKLLFWFFGLDDLFDNGTATISDLELLVKSFQDKDNLKHIHDDDTREKASNLVHIFEETIEELNLPDEGRNIVYYCLRKTLYGMLLECKNSFDDLDKYLHFGKYTSGISLLFSTQIFSDDISLKHKNSILQILETAGEIIRIYNDIKSYKREQAEGKNSSINILINNDMSFNDAIYLLDYIASTKLGILRSKYTDNSFLRKHVRFLLKTINGIGTFYQAFDFHEFRFESSSSDKTARLDKKLPLTC